MDGWMERERDRWRRICVRAREIGIRKYLWEGKRWVEFDSDELDNVYSSPNMMAI
jgi:hypothetical protein